MPLYKGAQRSLQVSLSPDCLNFTAPLQMMVSFIECTTSGKDNEGGWWEAKEADRRLGGPERRLERSVSITHACAVAE